MKNVWCCQAVEIVFGDGDVSIMGRGLKSVR